MDDAGIAALQAAVNNDPNDARKHAALARGMFDRGRFTDSAKEFQTAANLDQNNASYRASGGQALLAQRLWGKAKEEFSAALQLDPNNAAYQSLLDRSSRSSRIQTRVKRIAAGLVLLAVLVAIALSLPDLDSNLLSHATPTLACGDVSPPQASATPAPPAATTAPTGAGNITAKPLAAQRGEVDFGRALTVRTLTVDLSLSPAPATGASFKAHANQFLRADGASLNLSDVTPTAVSDGQTLILTVCFDRDKQVPLGDPGSYTGSVTIDDSRLKAPVTIPVTVTMQYSNGVFLLWLLFAAIVPGAWCVWVLRSNRDGGAGAFTLDFFRWAVTVNGLVALVAGSVAAFAVYNAVYLRDSTWGYSGLQPLTLYGGMFSAYVTTSGLASLTGRKQ